LYAINFVEENLAELLAKVTPQLGLANPNLSTVKTRIDELRIAVTRGFHPWDTSAEQLRRAFALAQNNRLLLSQPMPIAVDR
jgi:hypothetical protein